VFIHAEARFTKAAPTATRYVTLEVYTDACAPPRNDSST